jgi:hypothetical protein
LLAFLRLSFGGLGAFLIMVFDALNTFVANLLNFSNASGPSWYSGFNPFPFQKAPDLFRN